MREEKEKDAYERTEERTLYQVLRMTSRLTCDVTQTKQPGDTIIAVPIVQQQKYFHLPTPTLLPEKIPFGQWSIIVVVCDWDCDLTETHSSWCPKRFAQLVMPIGIIATSLDDCCLSITCSLFRPDLILVHSRGPRGFRNPDMKRRSVDWLQCQVALIYFIKNQQPRVARDFIYYAPLSPVAWLSWERK